MIENQFPVGANMTTYLSIIPYFFAIVKAIMKKLSRNRTFIFDKL